MVSPALWTVTAGLALVLVLATATALWSPTWVVDPKTCGTLALLSLPASVPWIAPLAGATGVVAALGRWQDEGAWTGIRASGGRLGGLAIAALLVGLLSGTTTGLAEHWLAPQARSAARHALGSPAERVRLRPGRTVALGEASLRATEVDAEGATGVLVRTAELIGSARQARILDTASGPVLDLRQGSFIGAGAVPWRLEFERWSRPISLPLVRVELSERSTPELAAAVARTEAAGRDASYERTVLYKRWLHPLGALLLPIAVLPLGLRRQRWPGLVSAAFGYVAAVRLGDLAAASVGPLLAAGIGPLSIALLGSVLWATEAER